MSAKNDDKAIKEKLDAYEKDRNDLVTHRLEAMKIYEGLLTSINLGSFGISLAYVFKLMDLGIIRCPGLIISSWLLMGTALFSGLLAHKSSIDDMYKRIKNINKKCRNLQENNSSNNKNYSNEETPKKDKKPDTFSTVQLITTIVSVFLMVLFVTLNIINPNLLIKLEGVTG